MSREHHRGTGKLSLHWSESHSDRKIADISIHYPQSVTQVGSLFSFHMVLKMQDTNAYAAQRYVPQVKFQRQMYVMPYTDQCNIYI